MYEWSSYSFDAFFSAMHCVILLILLSMWCLQSMWRNTPRRKPCGSMTNSNHRPVSPVWVTFRRMKLRTWSYNLWPVLCTFTSLSYPALLIFTLTDKDIVNLSIILTFMIFFLLCSVSLYICTCTNFIVLNLYWVYFICIIILFVSCHVTKINLEMPCFHYQKWSFLYFWCF